MVCDVCMSGVCIWCVSGVSEGCVMCEVCVQCVCGCVGDVCVSGV